MARSQKYYQYINSPKWKEKSKSCQQLTNNHCVVFFWLKSKNTHHLTYKNLGNEIPVRDLVPLSLIAHWFVHLAIFWKTPLRKLTNIFLRLLMIIWVFFWRILLVGSGNTSKRRRKRKKVK